MFELNGEYYSLEEIEQAAADSNVSVEDYIAEFSINKVEDVSLDKPEIEQLSSYVDELVGVSKQAKENIIEIYGELLVYKCLKMLLC